MDNTITQDDDDGGEIMFISNYLLCRKYPYPHQAAFVNSNGVLGRWVSKAKLLKENFEPKLKFPMAWRWAQIKKKTYIGPGVLYKA